MVLELTRDFLLTLPMATASGDGSHVQCWCPRCDYEGTSKPHLSVSVDVGPTEPLLFKCFRATCDFKGVLTTDVLREMGCIDPDTLNELHSHNLNVGPYVEKTFEARDARDIVISNVPRGNTREKLAYVSKRLGIAFEYDQLKELKIQLGLMEMLRVNDIRKLAASTKQVRNLDVYCIGFVSMYNDYLICRDISQKMVTGRRYHTYRISGKADKSDTKVYSIPREIDLLDPRSDEINVAEGAFSIIGAYLNSGIRPERPNSLWLANCGSEYKNTILNTVKRYGLLKNRIAIWSDSEIKVAYYRKLYGELKERMDIRRFVVRYNSLDEDFGVPRNRIRTEEVVIFGRDD